MSVALLLAACGSKDSGPANKTEDRPPPAPPERRSEMSLGLERLPEPALELPKQYSFRLLEQGAEPRAPLRYDVAASEAVHAFETRLTGRRLEGPAWSKPQALPPIRTRLAVVGTSGGKVRARPLPGEIDGAPTTEVVQYLAGWKALEGRRVAIELDSRGRLGELVFADDPTGARSEAAKDELAQRLLAMVVPLPDEPVGIGATWRSVTILRQRPAVVKQTATYTLLARTEAGWKIRVELQRIGESQVVIDPAVPADTAIELVALVRRMTGTLELQPSRALPTGSLEVDSSMHLRLHHKRSGTREEILEDSGTVTLSVTTQ